MKLAAIVAGGVLVCSLQALPASAIETDLILPCVTESAFDHMPEGKTQKVTEHALHHPPAHGNPFGSDNETYSVIYKACGIPWTQGGLFVDYERGSRKESFTILIGPLEGIILDVCWTCSAGPRVKS